MKIDADKVEDLENMPVIQVKEHTIVSIHPSHTNEDEDHQVCEAEKALEAENARCICLNSNKYKKTGSIHNAAAPTNVQGSWNNCGGTSHNVKNGKECAEG